MRGSLTRAGVLLTVVAAALLLAPAAHAAGEGISGAVVHGAKATPVAGAEVRIQLFDDQGQIGTGKATTAADGTFSFAPPAGTAGFQAGVTYEGHEYLAPAQQYVAGQVNDVTVTVYDPTTDAADVTLTQWVVWIDHEGDALAVQQDFGWTNGGDQAYVGGKDGVMTVPLPADAANLQFLGTFLEQRGDVRDGIYRSDAPIVPGDSTATIRYTSPTLRSMTLPVAFATQDLQIFAPEDLAVEGGGLRLAGTITDQGVTYKEYVPQALSPGSTVQFELTPTGGSAAGSNRTLLLLAVAGVALLAAVGFFVLGRRRRARPAPKRPQRPARATKPAQRRPAPQTHAPQARPKSGRAPADDDEVQLLVDEIAALDLSFEQGLLDERTYRRLRVAAKDRLLVATEAAGREVAR